MTARAALDSAVATLTSAVSPTTVHLSSDPTPSDTANVVVELLDLRRIGRSRRDGSLLDLELLTAVHATGPTALDLVEQMLVALEPHRYDVEPLPAAARRPDPRAPGVEPGVELGFQLRIPVSVPMTEPDAPLVTQPPVVRIDVVPSGTGPLAARPPAHPANESVAEPVVPGHGTAHE